MGKVLLTGGGGFLLRNLRELYPNHNYVFPTSKQVNWATGYGVESLPTDVDVVVHAAAVMGGIEFITSHKEKILLDNTRMNANFFEWVLNVKPRKVITMGSGCAYPGYVTGVLKEDDLACGKLHNTVEIYGFSKLWMQIACEQLLDNWDHLVLANMYGRYDHIEYTRSHVIAALIVKFIRAQREGKNVQLLGTGVAQRDIMYVGDMCQAINASITTAQGACRPINISTGVGTSIKDLATTIAECISFKGEILWGDETQDGALYKVMDNSLMKKHFDINITPLREGLEKTIPWFQDNC